MKLKDLMKSSFLTYETSQLLTNPEFGYTKEQVKKFDSKYSHMSEINDMEKAVKAKDYKKVKMLINK